MANENADKRKVSTDALETLGNIITPNEKRDAIHIAVDPIEADEKLAPGQDVGILPNGKASSRAEKLLGIVDPFLKRAVMPGEYFWLLVYPRQITSLRHVWSHPEFKEPDAGGPFPFPLPGTGQQVNPINGKSVRRRF